MTNETRHRSLLQDIAHRAMLERGLLPDFSPEVLAEVDKIQAPEPTGDAHSQDLRAMQWCSIDNNDSLDLDQLTVAASLPGGQVKVMVATADVALLVSDGTAIDGHARHNTTSVYTAAEKFPMLPDKLSTDLTSLNQDQDRMAVVVDMVLDKDGNLKTSDVYRAIVRNHAKLTYSGTGAWLEGTGPVPDAVAAVPGLADNLRMQDAAAQDLKVLRQAMGALSLQTIQSRPVFEGDTIRGLEVELKNRATELIENFMIAANGITVRFLASRKSPCIRRVVHTPKRWDRIVEVAAEQGVQLPTKPDAKALEAFLIEQKKAHPETFPDLSLTIIKLLGPGEYVAQAPGEGAEGHFGLAVRDYTHSTAPNRRYPDLITQRLLKATLENAPVPYAFDELAALATHCTEQEDAANKTERQVAKSAAALLLQSRIGEQFNAIVTGAADKGTWARLLTVPVEGRVVRGFEGLDVGQRTRVQLISVDVERGFIDLKRVGH
ncbi:MAG TPA: RNB domain-containing ribonuclease [Clostridia bacterium]|nr:RNB domain-containing ribonuclease [Clostridia bacterium]